MGAGSIAGEVAVGLVVGILVGLTGLGGGMVLLPLLISVLGVPPILAVGSDAVINCITKIGAGGLHWRQGNVNWRLVLSLAYGSIPGAILGVMILARVRAEYGNGVNDFLRVVIGALLMVFYGLPPALMVGTDIVHAVLLAGLTGLLQFRLGNVNLQLVACVLLGSVPGGLLGAYLTNYLPSTRLKQILCTLLVAVGTRMLWGFLLHAN